MAFGLQGGIMENVTMTYEYFIDEVKTYISDLNELDIIKKAYDYAYQVHKGAKRLSILLILHLF